MGNLNGYQLFVPARMPCLFLILALGLFRHIRLGQVMLLILCRNFEWRADTYPHRSEEYQEGSGKGLNRMCVLRTPSRSNDQIAVNEFAALPFEESAILQPLDLLARQPLALQRL